MKRIVFPQYKFPYRGEWKQLTNKVLEAKPPGERAAIDEYIYDYQRNPLAYTLMHGRPNRKHGNDGTAFINDWKNDLPCLFAGSQQGKSFGGASKVGFYAVPCDPEWHCYQNHGIEFQEWPGPTEIIIASYSWDMTQVLWDTYLKVLPRHELGPYAPMWGSFPNEKGKGQPKRLNLKRGLGQVKLNCGTRITCLAFDQDMTQWEGRQCDAAHMDEQGEEDIFDALCARQTTRGDYTPIIVTLTGYMYENRPDTGAGGWIKRKIVDGIATKGRTFHEYRIRLQDVPDIFVSDDAKSAIIKAHIEEPRARKDEKALRHGRARVNGEWEEGGGCIIGAYSKEIHIIRPFDIRKYSPTYYRMIDPDEHGGPTACLLIAVMPWGDAVVFKEYYEFGKSIQHNAKGIVEDMCGNERIKVDDYTFEGQTWDIFEEKAGENGCDFYASEMDSRSFAKSMKDSGRTMGQVFQDYGCRVAPASGALNFSKTNDRGAVSIMCEFFELDPRREHINKRLNRVVPEAAAEYGAPKVYIFDDLRHFPAEITGWVRHPKTNKPTGADHLIDCFKYFTGRERPYQGDYRFETEDWENDVNSKRDYDKYTGW